MLTYKLLIEYDGTPFCGWQIQPNGRTIQAELEEALAILTKEKINIVGSGRTDSGVHARGQVAHFRTEAVLDTFKLRRSLDALVPPEIAVRHIEIAPPDFHARFDAKERRYHYYMSTESFALERNFRWFLRPAPNVDAMNEAANFLLGKHHFGAFCLTQSETENRVCTLNRAQWVADTIEGHWHFEIYGDRFLHGMVRAIVGTLVQIGQGKRDVEEMRSILESQDRRRAGFAAPPHGLVLEQVLY
jgi:tRNA pseudouridine38-40 synthase